MMLGLLTSALAHAPSRGAISTPFENSGLLQVDVYPCEWSVVSIGSLWLVES